MKKFDPNVPLTVEQVRKTIILPNAATPDKIVLLQDAAAKKFNAALRQTHPKSNIVLVGEVGSGKELMIKIFGEEYLKTCPVPEDIVTYLRFEENHAGFLKLPHSVSQKFVEEHNKSIEEVIHSLGDPMRGNVLGEKMASKRYHYLKESQAKQSEFRNRFPFSLALNGGEKGPPKVYLCLEDDYDEVHGEIRDKQKNGEKTALELCDSVTEAYEELEFPADTYIAEDFAGGIKDKLLEFYDAKSKVIELFKPIKPVKEKIAALNKSVKKMSEEAAKISAGIAAANPTVTDAALDSLGKITIRIAEVNEEIKAVRKQFNEGKEAIITSTEYIELNANAAKLYTEFKNAKYHFFKVTELEALEPELAFFDTLLKQSGGKPLPQGTAIDLGKFGPNSFHARRKHMLPGAVTEARAFIEDYYIKLASLGDFIEKESERFDLAALDSKLGALEASYLTGENAKCLKPETVDKIKGYYASLREEFKDKRRMLISALQQNDIRSISTLANRLKVDLKLESKGKAQLVIDDVGTLAESIGMVERDMMAAHDAILPHVTSKLGKLFQAENGIYAFHMSTLKSQPALAALLDFARTGSLHLTDRYGLPFTEEVMINTKLVLFGEPEWGGMFRQIPELSDVFRNIIYLDETVDCADENLAALVSIFEKDVVKNKYLPLADDAKKEMVRLAMRKTGNSAKLSTQCNFYSAFLAEVDQRARAQNAEAITEQHILETIIEKCENNPLKKWVMDSFRNGTTDCYVPKEPKAGCINGLAVYASGSEDIFQTVGILDKIDALVRPGEGFTCYAEQDAELTDKVFNMSTAKVDAWFNTELGPLAKYADFNLSQEQCYGGVGGDSASCVFELCKLSALSGLAISPHFAMTGSMNLMGELTAVGGLNHKIEGAIDAFREFDRNLEKGDYVIVVPPSTVGNLVLRKDYAEFIAQGKVKIYAVTEFKDVVKHAMGKEYAFVKYACIERLKDFKKELEDLEPDKDKP